MNVSEKQNYIKKLKNKNQNKKNLRALTRENNAAVRMLLQMKGVSAQTPPPKIRKAPLSSSGSPKEWVTTPQYGAHGMPSSPMWMSPAPILNLGKKYRRATRKANRTA